jgi:hypothetical protein
MVHVVFSCVSFRRRTENTQLVLPAGKVLIFNLKRFVHEGKNVKKYGCGSPSPAFIGCPQYYYSDDEYRKVWAAYLIPGLLGFVVNLGPIVCVHSTSNLFRLALTFVALKLSF